MRRYIARYPMEKLNGNGDSGRRRNTGIERKDVAAAEARNGRREEDEAVDR